MSCKIIQSTPIYNNNTDDHTANVLASFCLWSEFILSIIFALAPLYHQYPPLEIPLSYRTNHEIPSIHLRIGHRCLICFCCTWCEFFLYIAVYLLIDTGGDISLVQDMYYSISLFRSFLLITCLPSTLPYSHHMHTIPFLYNSPYFHRVQQPPVKGVVSSQIRDVVLAPLPPLHSPNKLPRR